MSGAAASALCLLFLSSAAFLGAQDVSRHYTEVHGQQVSSVEYRIRPTGNNDREVSSIGAASTDTIRWRPGVGTYDWQLADPKAGTSLHGVRSGDVIHVTGTLKNRSVDREVKVDSAPWYQVFGPLLQEILPDGAAQKEFWVVNPDDLSAHKMQVKRAGTDRLTIRGAAVDTYKIHFSPAGALAPFWGADFWYRQSDSAYVSSRLPENGGLTVTTIEEASK
jgi:hypothetical protein